MEQQTSIKKKSLDQATVNQLKKILGTTLIILSGVLLYLDKIINYFGITLDLEFRYYSDISTYIWYVAQTVSPLILILAFQFKPEKWSLMCPLSIYSIQFMYLLRDEHFIEAQYFWLYTIMFILAFVGSYFLLNKLIKVYAINIYKLKNNIKDLIAFILYSRKNFVDANKLDLHDPKMINVLKDTTK